MNDRFLSMQLFARVARTGSFSVAGREVGLSQPSASRIVAALEKRMGVPLLRRTTRGVVLTDAGSEYLARTDAILAALDEADQAARGAGELRGVLRIACSATFAQRSVFPCLPKFADAHPQLRIEFRLGDHLQDIVADGVDISFRMGTSLAPGLIARRIGANNRLLAASPFYLDRAGVPQCPDDLLRHTLIIGPAGQSAEGWTFRKSERSQVLRVEGRFCLDSTEAATSAAAAGLGIVSTSRLACSRELQQGSLVKLLPDWEMPWVDVHAIYVDGRASKQSARAFAAFVSEELQGR